MSTSKVDTSAVFLPVTVEAHQTRVKFFSGSVRIRKTGLELRTATAIPVWTEMSVDLEAMGSARRIQCRGVVVACHGSRHEGFLVSMLFTGLSRQTAEKLEKIASLRA